MPLNNLNNQDDNAQVIPLPDRNNSNTCKWFIIVAIVAVILGGVLLNTNTSYIQGTDEESVKPFYMMYMQYYDSVTQLCIESINHYFKASTKKFQNNIGNEIVSSKGTVELEEPINFVNYTQIVTNNGIHMNVTLQNTGDSTSITGFNILYRFNPTVGGEAKYMKKKYSGSQFDSGIFEFMFDVPMPINLGFDYVLVGDPYIIFEVEKDDKVVLSSTITLPPEIIFKKWIDQLNGRVIRVMILGEQYAFKTTIINNILNAFLGLGYSVNFVPPSTDILDAGTIGVIRIASKNNNLMKTIEFFDSEGARSGEFPAITSIEEILTNPPQNSYYKAMDHIHQNSDEYKLPQRNLTEFTVAEKLTETIDFVIHPIRYDKITPNENGEISLDENIIKIHSTISAGVSSFNEKHKNFIQPLTLITHPAEDESEEQMITQMKALLDAKSPIMVFDTTYERMPEGHELKVVKSIVNLLSFFLSKINTL